MKGLECNVDQEIFYIGIGRAVILGEGYLSARA